MGRVAVLYGILNQTLAPKSKPRRTYYDQTWHNMSLRRRLTHAKFGEDPSGRSVPTNSLFCEFSSYTFKKDFPSSLAVRSLTLMAQTMHVGERRWLFYNSHTNFGIWSHHTIKLGIFHPNKTFARSLSKFFYNRNNYWTKKPMNIKFWCNVVTWLVISR